MRIRQRGSDTSGRTGEPFGIAIPLTVPSGIVVGWGAGVAAPWPMPLAALIAGTTAGRAEGSPAPGYISAGLGIACIAGTFIEPVTYRRWSWTPLLTVSPAWRQEQTRLFAERSKTPGSHLALLSAPR